MCNGLRQRRGIGNIITVLQPNRLRWYEHVPIKDENDWVKKMHGLQSGRCKTEVDQRKLVERL